LEGACGEPGAQEGVLVAVVGGGVDREAEGMSRAAAAQAAASADDAPGGGEQAQSGGCTWQLVALAVGAIVARGSDKGRRLREAQVSGREQGRKGGL